MSLPEGIDDELRVHVFGDFGELAAGTLKPLPMREGGVRFAQLYLVYADRENAGPGTVRLAEILVELARAECDAQGVA